MKYFYLHELGDSFKRSGLGFHQMYMKEQFKISDHFPPHIFWDVDPDRLEIHEDTDLIIPRALLATTAETFEQDITAGIVLDILAFKLQSSLLKYHGSHFF